MYLGVRMMGILGIIVALVAVVAIGCAGSSSGEEARSVDAPSVDTGEADVNGHERVATIDAHDELDDHDEAVAALDDHDTHDDVIATVDHHADDVDEADLVSLEHDADEHQDDAHLDVIDFDGPEPVEILLAAVEGRPWRFEPSLLEIVVGQPVKLILINDGRAEHDIEVAGLEAEGIQVLGVVTHDGGHAQHEADVVAAHAMPGTTASVIFTATEPGEYEFICTIPGHKEAGMVGRLIVTTGIS